MTLIYNPDFVSFRTSDPFASFFNMGGLGGGGLFDDDENENGTFINFGMGMPGGGMGRRTQSFNVHGSPQKSREFQQQDTAVEHDLYVSLEDIDKGCTKKMKISRNVIAPDGTRKKEDKVLTINVKPGWKAGTKITFPREGDQTTGKIPADIVFIIRDKPHPQFKRENCDIRYTAKITLREVRDIFLYLVAETLILFGRFDKTILEFCVAWKLKVEGCWRTG